MLLPDKRLLKNIDFFLIINILLILLISVMVMPSASASIAEDPLFYMNRQLMWIGIGLVFMLFILTIDYLRLRDYTTYLYALNVFILLLVISPLGHEAKGAQRWLALGPLMFQASEFAKILLIITFADFLAKREGRLRTFKQFIPCFIFVGIPMFLILIQPDLGTSLVFVAIFIGMMFFAGANIKILGGLVFLGLATIISTLMAYAKWGISLLPIKDYQFTRLVVFLNPYEDGMGGRGAGYQYIQSKVAIGSGGLTGKGLYEGTQSQLNFLPEHHTDFIFSVAGEELGFIGAIVILLLYFLLIYRSAYIMSQAKDMFGLLIVAGVASMFAFHVLVNIGMTVGIMPVTGLPLPLFSYGNNSMLANLIALGLVLNVYMRRKKIIF